MLIEEYCCCKKLAKTKCMEKIVILCVNILKT